MDFDGKEPELLDRLFGQHRDFAPAEPKVRFAILASPRTGSQMLCSVLSATRLAGHPQEYLNGRYFSLYMRELKMSKWSFDVYLNDILRRRTSPNGVFGIKLQAVQYQQVFGKAPDPDRFLTWFNRWIRITRRQKIDQAISHMLAVERRLWQVESDGPLPPDREFVVGDVEKIASNLAKVASEDLFWVRKLEKLGIDALEVTYEDLVADPRKEIGRVLDYLGVALPGDQIPSPTTRRLGGEGNRALREAFLRAVGEA